METCLSRVEHLMPWQTSAEGFIVGMKMEVSVMDQEGRNTGELLRNRMNKWSLWICSTCFPNLMDVGFSLTTDEIMKKS